jgi:hypothetical protein
MPMLTVKQRVVAVHSPGGRGGDLDMIERLTENDWASIGEGKLLLYRAAYGNCP